MPGKAVKRAEDLPTTLLKRLPKVELPQIDVESRFTEFRFEQNVLSAAGMTHKQEISLLQRLVGEERWTETQTPPEGTPGREEE